MSDGSCHILHIIRLSFRLESLDDPVRWDLSDVALSSSGLALDVRRVGVIGDYEEEEEEKKEDAVVMVDFANRRPGFGPGFTQEELLLGTRPEACVLSPVLSGLGPGGGGLRDRQAVLVTGGCRRFARFGFDPDDGELVELEGTVGRRCVL